MDVDDGGSGCGKWSRRFRVAVREGDDGNGDGEENGEQDEAGEVQEGMTGIAPVRSFMFIFGFIEAGLVAIVGATGLAELAVAAASFERDFVVLLGLEALGERERVPVFDARNHLFDLAGSMRVVRDEVCGRFLEMEIVLVERGFKGHDSLPSFRCAACHILLCWRVNN